MALDYSGTPKKNLKARLNYLREWGRTHGNTTGEKNEIAHIESLLAEDGGAPTRPQGFLDDLRAAGVAARDTLREKKLRHVVYAYIEKDFPDTIQLLDWGPKEFKTDADFEAWLLRCKDEAEIRLAPS